MALPKSRIKELLGAVQSDVLATGHFTGVFGAEPLGAAGIEGLTVAVWCDNMRALPGRGLASTSVLLTLFIRIYSRALGLAEYRDEIDPSMMAASADIFGMLIGGFTLDGFATPGVDVKGQHGNPVEAKAGHLTLDKTLFRVYDIIFSIAVDDLWVEAP